MKAASRSEAEVSARSVGQAKHAATQAEDAALRAGQVRSICGCMLEEEGSAPKSLT